MSIVNRRNAVIGYLALRALKRARRNAAFGYIAVRGMERTRARRSNRRALKMALYVLLGVVSLGILAAATGFAKRRQGGAAALETATEPLRADGAGPGTDPGVPAEAEPAPAT